MNKRLWYRFAENESLVLAPPNEAQRCHSIRTALETSKTWGEFRQQMPREDFEEIVERMREYGEDDDVPRPDDLEFDSSGVPGYCDGDYPDWLQAQAHEYVPRDLLEKFGEEITTTLNGNYWHIPKAHIPALVTALESRGYEVTERADLHFF